MKKSHSRRSFLKKAATTATAVATGNAAFSAHQVTILKSSVLQRSAAEIRIGLIGSGIIGHYDTEAALKVNGVKLTAVCDLYTGRLVGAKEKWGKDIFTTRDYRELLARPDIDAVLVCTSDNWHKQIAVDALMAGKHVYCEKPMVQYIEQGQEIIDAHRLSGKVFQVGSQRASNVAVLQAKALYEKGVIGELTNVQANDARWSSNGAWNYSIPTDASPETVDFDTFLGTAPKVPFDPVRFFRWRNFQEYGTGIAGDLFVHMFTAIHVVTGAVGPERIFSLGDLYYWKDGRSAFDLVTGMFDYPKTDKHANFQFMTQVNLANGSTNSNFGIRFIGTEGVITLGWNDLKLETIQRPVAPGYGGYDSYNTFSNQGKNDFKRWYEATYGNASTEPITPEPTFFAAAPDYDDRVDHMRVFFTAIRNNRPQDIVENAVFGLRAAGPSIACNLSANQRKVINWNPVEMKVM